MIESETPQPNSSGDPFNTSPSNNPPSPTYGVGINGANSLDLLSGNSLVPVPPQTTPNNGNGQDIPENSLTTALFIMAGLIFLRPRKIF